MAKQERAQRPEPQKRDREDLPDPPKGPSSERAQATSKLREDLDDVLDDIDRVLAESQLNVDDYRQKGGQ